MDDPLGVSRSETGCDLDRVIDGFSDRKGAMGQLRVERVAFEQLGHNEWLALMRAHIVNDQNVRMIEGGGRIAFQLEAPKSIRIRCVRGRQELDGDSAMQALITRPINFAHPARAKGSLNLVRAKADAWLEWHGVELALYAV